MTVSYIDIVQAMQRVSKDGRTVDHAVITEDTKEEFMENMVTAEDPDGTAIPSHDDNIGTVNQFDVQVGNEHKIVTKDGTVYPIS